MVWLLCICIVLVVAVLALSIKIIVMRRAATEICMELTEKLKSDTNTLISISTEDKAMSRLADSINVQLKELYRQRRRFTQGDLELKTAITNISHDLRTPLTAISSYLDLLDKAEKSEKVERYLAIIRDRTEALSLLTEEMFGYSLINSPEYEVKAEPVCVNSVLENSILEYYAALQERGMTPDICITEKQVVRDLDKIALSRIFSNLLNNALKYSSGDLRIELTEEGRITFSNTALGLSELQVERLFDRFYTLESARKSTGLGLSIARILTERMNGTITAAYEDRTLRICIVLPEE